MSFVVRLPFSVHGPRYIPLPASEYARPAPTLYCRRDTGHSRAALSSQRGSSGGVSCADSQLSMGSRQRARRLWTSLRSCSFLCSCRSKLAFSQISARSSREQETSISLIKDTHQNPPTMHPFLARGSSRNAAYHLLARSAGLPMQILITNERPWSLFPRCSRPLPILLQTLLNTDHVLQCTHTHNLPLRFLTPESRRTSSRHRSHTSPPPFLTRRVGSKETLLGSRR